MARALPIRTVVIAVLVSAGMLTAAILTVLALWQPAPLSAFLPELGTVVLFEETTVDDVRPFATEFPALSSLPDHRAPIDIAVVETESGTQGWVMTARRQEAPLPSVSHRIGRQTFLLSSPHISTLLESGDLRLRGNPLHRALAALPPKAKPRVILRDRMLAMLPTPLRVLLRGVTDDASPGALGIDAVTHEVTLRVPTSATGLRPQKLPPLAALDPPPDASIAALDGARLLSGSLESGLDPDRRSILEGLLLAKMGQVIPGQWSIRYDLLPLFAGPVSLHLRSSGSSLFFLLERGRPSSVEGLERFDSLHNRFLSSLGSTIIDRRELAIGTRSAVIRSDPSQAEDRSWQENGWALRRTGLRDGSSVLITAVNAKRLLMSNNQAWIEQATSVSAQQIAQPGAHGGVLAHGVIERKVLAGLTADPVASPLWNTMQGAFGESTRIAWTLSLENTIATLVLRGLILYPVP